jgi:peptidoglycan endopeptidase LytF
MYKYITVLLASNLMFLANIKAHSIIDSIGVENLNGSKLIIHQIVKNDTYYSVGRRYNVSPKEIMTFNENKYLQVGVLIKVPTKIPFASQSASATAKVNAPSGSTESALIDYEVKPKDNLNSIARTHSTTVNELRRINELRSINLRIGQQLKVPAPQEAASAAPENTIAQSTVIPQNGNARTGGNVSNKPVEQPKPILPPGTNNAATRPAVKAVDTATRKPVLDEKFIEHTVASNETMYSIATTYKMTIDQLKAKNNLQNNSLHVGQKLLISGQYPVKTEPAADSLDDATIKDPSLRGDASRYGLNQVDEKGTAVWITDQDLDPVKMLVLHRTAPVGTIVKITNPMTNRSAFAKVVGKYTENESTKDVILVMTKAVADSIGAIDKRFFCNITYSGQDNEQ